MWLSRSARPCTCTCFLLLLLLGDRIQAVVKSRTFDSHLFHHPLNRFLAFAFWRVRSSSISPHSTVTRAPCRSTYALFALWTGRTYSCFSVYTRTASLLRLRSRLACSLEKVRTTFAQRGPRSIPGAHAVIERRPRSTTSVLLSLSVVFEQIAQSRGRLLRAVTNPRIVSPVSVGIGIGICRCCDDSAGQTTRICIFSSHCTTTCPCRTV